MFMSYIIIYNAVVHAGEKNVGNLSRGNMMLHAIINYCKVK